MSSDNNKSSKPGQKESGGHNKGGLAAFAAAPVGTEQVVPEGPKAPERYSQLGHGARKKIGVAVSLLHCGVRSAGFGHYGPRVVGPGGDGAEGCRVAVAVPVGVQYLLTYFIRADRGRVF